MYRLFSSILIALALVPLSATPAAAQRLGGGAVAAQVLGRVRLNADFSVNLYGYFTAMESISGSLFNGAPGENTALFTFVAQPTGAMLIKNGDLVHGLENPPNGQFTTLTVYYNGSPSTRDINNPDDFAQGMPVASFRSRSAAVNVLPGSTFQASAGLAILSSSFFYLNGQPTNIASIVNALSLTLSGASPSFDAITAGLGTDGFYSFPFAGSAIAVGQ